MSRVAVMKAAWIVALSALAGRNSAAQDTANVQPVDGVTRPVRDSMLENLVGRWQLTRVMGGASAGSSVEAHWVLNHKFLELHYIPDRGSQQPYEAIVYIGFDNMSDRYVVHWLDIFGGRVSETIGFGARVANGLRLLFEYPDGPFTNTLSFDPATRSWNLLLRQKNQRGEWTTFATEQWRRVQ